MSKKCIKCGSDNINTVYHEAVEIDSCYPRGYGECKDKTEHLCKCCRNCQYKWKEPTLDTVEPVGKEKE